MFINIWWWIGIWVFYCIQAWVSQKNNVHGGNWLWIAIVYSCIPVWPLITRVSKSLLIDGMIYDLVLFGSYVLTLLYLGAGEKFGTYQWAGLAFVVVGFILLKVRI